MKTIRLFQTRFLLLATLTVAAASSAACAPQPVQEEKGVSKAKLLAPRPMMKASASPTSRDSLGVSEWRIYRGRNDVVLTGYDEDGKPVKGLSVGFHASSDTSNATLRTRVLDGSMFAARHEYAQGLTVESGQMPAETAAFLQQALSDIAVLRQSVARNAQTGSTSGRTFGTTPQCGADMMAIISNALQCIQSKGGAQNTTAVSQCVAAAQSAAGVGAACQSTGTTPYDPTQGTDPWGTGGWGDPMGQQGSCGQPTDPYGQGGMGTPCGGSDPWGQDPYGGTGADPYGQGGTGADPYGGWGGGMPTGDWCGDPFGDGASCPSCGGMGGAGGMGGMGGDDWGGAGGMGGMGGDICANPMNGDVGYEGDFGGGDWGAGF